MKKLLIIAALFAAPAYAQSEWRYVGESQSGSHWYILDRDFYAGHSQSRSARMWIKTDDRRNSKVPWMESKQLFSVDCVTESYRMIASTVYYRDGSNEHGGAGSLTYAVPGSILASALEMLCADPTPTRSSGPLNRT